VTEIFGVDGPLFFIFLELQVEFGLRYGLFLFLRILTVIRISPKKNTIISLQIKEKKKHLRFGFLIFQKFKRNKVNFIQLLKNYSNFWNYQQIHEQSVKHIYKMNEF
jgi:hypothetical protein